MLSCFNGCVFLERALNYTLSIMTDVCEGQYQSWNQPGTFNKINKAMIQLYNRGRVKKGKFYDRKALIIKHEVLQKNCSVNMLFVTLTS